MSAIRVAELADVEAIVRMGLAFLRESVFGKAIAENPEQMRRLATALITGEQAGVILLGLSSDGEPVGMVGGMPFVHPLSAEPMVTELFWYVTPCARGSIGVRLLKAFEGWVRASGAVANVMVQPIGAERVAWIYQGMGYAPIETGWMRRF